MNSHCAPFRAGLVALFVIVFVAQHHSRPIRQSEAEINPGLADVQVQILAQTWRHLQQGRSIAAGVIEIFSILLPSRMNKTKVVPIHGQSDFVIVQQRVAGEQPLGVGAGLPEQLKFFHAAVRIFLLRVQLAKFVIVAADRCCAENRRK